MSSVALAGCSATRRVAGADVPLLARYQPARFTPIAMLPFLSRSISSLICAIRRCVGAGAARNRAYRAASGDFIQFLDADDILAPDKIELQLARLGSRPDCIASAEWARFYRSVDEAAFIPDPVWRDLSPTDWLATSRSDGLGMLFPAQWLMPRQVAETAGLWDESLSLGDDGEYYTRAVLAARHVLFCERARCYYRSGISGSLSGRKSARAWNSGYRVLELCERHVLGRENSERMRRGFALSWQHMAHGCYPYDKAMAEKALARAAALHDVEIRPDGGPAFRLASRVFGWRAARRLQVASGRS